MLILTYYFPPLGLGGAQRVAKFVKYLPQFGWRPTVVTVKPIAYWATDLSLLQDVRDARVFRTESYDPQRLLARMGKTSIQTQTDNSRMSIGTFLNEKLLPFLLMPDSKILWQPFVQKAVKDLLAGEKFDALMTSSPPHSVHMIGRRIVKKYKLPWLTDFRDGWAGSHIVHEPTRWQYKQNYRLQKSVIADADAVVSASPGIDLAFKSVSFEPKKFYIITNGFDPQDFDSAAQGDNTLFTLCYSGTINKFADPMPFLDALVKMQQQTPQTLARLRVQFVGFDALGCLAKEVKKRGLAKVVDIIGHQDHSESVKYLVNANALLLIAKARETDTFIPGKTFEYIGAHKPVFAISNSRYTNALLSDYALAYVTDSFDPDKIFLRLKEFLHTKWNSISINLNLDRFNRVKQTEQLTEVLNTICRK